MFKTERVDFSILNFQSTRNQTFRPLIQNNS